MKKFIVLCSLCFVGFAGWRISEQLSADAIGMALGVLFGVLAGLPVALLVMASNRRGDRGGDRRGDNRGDSDRELYDDELGHYQYPQLRGRRQQQQALPPGYGYAMPPQQPPVIVFAGPPNGMAQGNPYGYDQGYPRQPRLLTGPQGMHPELPPERQYKVVGEKEEWIDEDW